MNVLFALFATKRNLVDLAIFFLSAVGLAILAEAQRELARDLHVRKYLVLVRVSGWVLFAAWLFGVYALLAAFAAMYDEDFLLPLGDLSGVWERRHAARSKRRADKATAKLARYDV